MFALRCNAGLRMLSGFLTMYMAFLLTQHPLPGFEDKRTLLLALVIGAAGLGNAVGIGLGSLLRKVNPVVTVVFALLADAAMALVCAVFYGLLTAVLLGLTAGVAQALGKVSLDSLIQRDVPEQVRTSGFARSETLLQLSWVRRRLHRHRAAAGARDGSRRAGRADGPLDRVRRCSTARRRPPRVAT